MDRQRCCMAYHRAESLERRHAGRDWLAQDSRPPPHPGLAESARFAVKLLSGTSVGDIPIEEPTKFELVINLKTAKALGLDASPSLSSPQAAMRIE
jgi:hypothetical protein